MWSYADVQSRLETAITETRGAFNLPAVERDKDDEHKDVSPLLSRAKEDLIGVVLLIRGKAILLPATWCLANVCFLLHQALEKWLKAWIKFGKGRESRIHALGELLQQGIQTLPDLQELFDLLNQESINLILGQGFPSHALRYAEPDENDLVVWIEALTTALCDGRSLIIKAMLARIENDKQQGDTDEV